MKLPKMPPSHAYQQGGTLLEVLIAILIFSIGVLGIIGLQANMTRAASEAKYRAEAGYIAQERVGRIWVDQKNANNYLEDGTDIQNQSGLPNGKRSTAIGTANCNGNAKCRHATVTVTWQQPDGELRNVKLVSHMTGVPD